MERTLVFIKPDGIQKKIIGEIISRFEKKGLTLEKMQMVTLSKAQVDSHYQEHLEKPFYPELRDYILSSPIVAMVWSGSNAIAVVRKLIGATNPSLAEPGTIRGDYALSLPFNLVHASDSVLSAEKEIKNILLVFLMLL